MFAASGLCSTTRKKGTNRNKYPWNKSLAEAITCKYECYLTKKSFDNSTEILTQEHLHKGTVNCKIYIIIPYIVQVCKQLGKYCTLIKLNRSGRRFGIIFCDFQEKYIFIWSNNF